MKGHKVVKINGSLHFVFVKRARRHSVFMRKLRAWTDGVMDDEISCCQMYFKTQRTVWQTVCVCDKQVNTQELIT